MSALPTVATLLGRAGLLPFIAAPLALLTLGEEHRTLVTRLLADYAFGIIAFLPGIWWGLGLIRGRASTLLMSNAIFLGALVGKWTLPAGAFLLLAAALLALMLLVERSHTLFRPQPAYYARVRIELTVVAVLALLLSAAIPGSVPG